MPKRYSYATPVVCSIAATTSPSRQDFSGRSRETHWQACASVSSLIAHCPTRLRLACFGFLFPVRGIRIPYLQPCPPFRSRHPVTPAKGLQADGHSDSPAGLGTESRVLRAVNKLALLRVKAVSDLFQLSSTRRAFPFTGINDRTRTCTSSLRG